MSNLYENKKHLLKSVQYWLKNNYTYETLMSLKLCDSLTCFGEQISTICTKFVAKCVANLGTG